MTAAARAPGSDRRLLPAILVVLAGVLGSAGILVSAAAAHGGGSTLAVTAGLFLLLHAAAIVGIAAFAQAVPGGGLMAGIAGSLLAAGAVLFSGELALAGLVDWRPFAAAAPIGGGLLIAGWLVLIAAGVAIAMRRT